MEIWKTIKDYPKYEVSNLGRIRSNTKKSIKVCQDRILSRIKSPQYGYLLVTLYSNGKRKKHYVHRLVLEAFCPKHEGRNYTNHLDCNPVNDNLENLKWVTQEENIRYAIKLGRKIYVPMSEEGRNKWRMAMSRKVVRSDGKIYNSLTEAARDIGRDKQCIWKICQGKRSSSKGFSFSYVIK